MRLKFLPIICLSLPGSGAFSVTPQGPLESPTATSTPCPSLDSSSSLTLSAGSHCYGSLRLRSGARLFILGAVHITSQSDVDIEAGAEIIGLGTGYAADLGPGKSSSPGAGAGHGGAGGASALGPGGPAYDDASAPSQPGSGGAGNLAGGGAGGAALVLEARLSRVSIAGRIDLSGVQGGDCACPAGGGGSGGALRVEARLIQGNGQILARGGRGGNNSTGPGGGGGGGGMVNLCAIHASSYNGVLDVSGGGGGMSGLGSPPAGAGSPGTYRLCTLLPQDPKSEPTPLARQGEALAYPQPASDSACFELMPSQDSLVSVEVYNLAMQPVAKFQSEGLAKGGASFKLCESVRPLAPGVYLYRCRAGSETYPLRKLWVRR